MNNFALLFGKSKHALDAKVASLVSLDTTSAVNQIPYAAVSYTLPANAAHSKMFDTLATVAKTCEVGSEVEITKLGELLFAGIITQQTISIKNGKPMINLKLRHRLFVLQTLVRSQVFVNKSDMQIFGQLLKNEPLHVAPGATLGVMHEQMVQLNCTDWQFVRTRLKANDVWVLPHPASLALVVPKLGTILPHGILTPKGGSKMLNAVQWQTHYVDMAKGVNVHSWDTDKQLLNSVKSKATTLGTGPFDPSKIKSLKEQPWDVFYSMPLTHKEQSALANAMGNAELAGGVQARFEMPGTVKHKLGDTVELSGFGSHFSGKALLTGINHHAENGKWTTTLHTGLEPAVAGDEYYDLVPKAEGLFVGVVGEMKEDKQFRIQVQIPALGKDSLPLWARFSQPYASKDSGVCFYPEKGDEVVIAFFEGDPRYPVILGSMHNAKNKPPFAYTKDNEQRGFVFVHEKEKQSLLFDRKTSQVNLENFSDEKANHQSLMLDAKAMIVNLQNNLAEAEKKQSLILDAEKMQVHLQNNVAAEEKKQSLLLDATAMHIQFDNNFDNAEKKQTLLLDAKEMKINVDNVKEKLLLHSGIALSSSADNIALKAKKDITLEATAGVDVNSENHTIKAKKTLSLESMDTTLKGNKTLTQNGGEVKVSADQGLVLHATLALQAQGASAEVSGQSTVNIKDPKIDLGP